MRLERSDIEVEYFHDENGTDYKRECNKDDTFIRWYHMGRGQVRWTLYDVDSEEHIQLEEAVCRLVREEGYEENDE